MRPLTALLAKIFPDSAMRRQMAAREVIYDTSNALLDNWQAQAAQELAYATPLPQDVRDSSLRDDSASQLTFEPPRSPGALGKSSAGSHQTHPPFPGGVGGATGGGLGLSGIAPGSFLGLMLSARQRGTGEKLTDIQVLAQVRTFILAGYGESRL